MADLFALRTRIKRGRARAYERLHTNTPLELDDDLRALGVLEWRIWRRGRDLFHVVLVEDRERFRVGSASSVVQERWRAELASVLERRGAGEPLDLLWQLPGPH